MGVNLQISFFISTIILQIILIAIVIRGFEILQETVNFLEQKNSITEICSCNECKTENKKEAEKHTEKGEKETKSLYQALEGEETLFIKQIKLDEKNPVTEINITADRKEK